MIKTFSALPLLLLGLLVSGCGSSDAPSPDYVARLSDASGIQPGTPIRWMGMTVGSVSALAAGEGSVLVSLDVAPEHEGQLPETTTCRVASGVFQGGEPYLVLYAGPSDRTLAPGSTLPEAGFATIVSNTVTRQHLILAGGVLVALLVIGFILSGIKRLFAFGLAVLLLLFSLNLLRSQWHHVSDTFPGAQATIDRLLEQAAADPALRSFAEDVHQQAGELLQVAGRQGKQAATVAHRELSRKVAEEIAARRTSGDTEGLDLLVRLREALEKAGEHASTEADALSD